MLEAWNSMKYQRYDKISLFLSVQYFTLHSLVVIAYHNERLLEMYSHKYYILETESLNIQNLAFWFA